MSIHNVLTGSLTSLVKDSFADSYCLSLIELIYKCGLGLAGLVNDTLGLRRQEPRS